MRIAWLTFALATAGCASAPPPQPVVVYVREPCSCAAAIPETAFADDPPPLRRLDYQETIVLTDPTPFSVTPIVVAEPTTFVGARPPFFPHPHGRPALVGAHPSVHVGAHPSVGGGHVGAHPSVGGHVGGGHVGGGHVGGGRGGRGGGRGGRR